MPTKPIMLEQMLLYNCNNSYLTYADNSLTCVVAISYKPSGTNAAQFLSNTCTDYAIH